MAYLLTFLEGVISFISPCILPLLPLYLSYFAGSEEDVDGKHVWARSAAFVGGFTVLFVLMGLFAGTLGSFLQAYRVPLRIGTGIIVILLGLSYLGLFRIPIFQGMKEGRLADSIPSAFLFGLLYSLSLTPCVGAFLGSALLLASQQGSAQEGALLLFTYSIGLGIPFILSAVLIDRLKGAFDWIKKRYDIITKISGAFLIVLGILMAVGLLDRWIALLS